MSAMRAMFGRLTLATALGLASAASNAALFTISNQSFAWDAGYGVDATEPGTLLDVVFTAASPPLAFTLTSAGDSSTFLFGTINFREENINKPPPSSTGDETDDLGVSASFTFSSPSAGTQTVTATGSAVAGPVVDDLVDYTLTWTPIQVPFATTGLFSIDLETLSWNGKETSSTKNLNATITLLRAPEQQPQQPQQQSNGAPEPSSILLLGSALAALGWRRVAKKPV